MYDEDQDEEDLHWSELSALLVVNDEDGIIATPSVPKEGGDTFMFEDIIDGPRRKDGKYLVSWEGHAEDHNTWEPPTNTPTAHLEAHRRRPTLQTRDSDSDSDDEDSNVPIALLLNNEKSDANEGDSDDEDGDTPFADLIKMGKLGETE
jgi:hypothetical protein